MMIKQAMYVAEKWAARMFELIVFVVWYLSVGFSISYLAGPQPLVARIIMYIIWPVGVIALSGTKQTIDELFDDFNKKHD